MYGYIYLVLNKVNGKTYIGQRKYYRAKSWNEDPYMGSGKILGLAKQKYGLDNFEKFLIQYVESREEADTQERFWIAEYRKRGKAEYNIANGGWNSGMIDRHHTEESKRKIAKKLQGRKLSIDTIQRMKDNYTYHAASKGKHWFNDGSIETYAVVCPEGFVKGRL